MSRQFPSGRIVGPMILKAMGIDPANVRRFVLEVSMDDEVPRLLVEHYADRRLTLDGPLGMMSDLHPQVTTVPEGKTVVVDGAPQVVKKE